MPKSGATSDMLPYQTLSVSIFCFTAKMLARRTLICTSSSFENKSSVKTYATRSSWASAYIWAQTKHAKNILFRRWPSFFWSKWWNNSISGLPTEQIGILCEKSTSRYLPPIAANLQVCMVGIFFLAIDVSIISSLPSTRLYREEEFSSQFSPGMQLWTGPHFSLAFPA